MPFYNTVTAAAAIGVTPKWLDNLLSHNNLEDIQRDSQGVARRLSFKTITILALAEELINSVQLAAPSALRLAEQLLADPGGEVAVSPRLRITVQTDALRSTVLSRLARAVEVTPTPRRGRPPRQPKR